VPSIDEKFVYIDKNDEIVCDLTLNLAQAVAEPRAAPKPETCEDVVDTVARSGDTAVDETRSRFQT
jgi:hypothetical protein